MHPSGETIKLPFLRFYRERRFKHGLQFKIVQQNRLRLRNSRLGQTFLRKSGRRRVFRRAKLIFHVRKIQHSSERKSLYAVLTYNKYQIGRLVSRIYPARHRVPIAYRSRVNFGANFEPLHRLILRRRGQVVRNLPHTFLISPTLITAEILQTFRAEKRNRIRRLY
jgi:hypothetical protein